MNLQRPAILLRQVLIAIVSALLIWVIIFMFLEESFIFFPSHYPDGDYARADLAPDIENHWITTEDGVKLHAWFVRAEDPIATLIVSHGNAGNISHRLDILRRLQRTGFSVLMYDYRGYGRSEGKPSEHGIYLDGRATYDYTVRIAGVDSLKIILWGTSLGGAVAVDVATSRTVAGLILESTFTSAPDVARRAYPFLPFHFIMKSSFNSENKIRSVHVPSLFMHGTKDRIIDIELGRKLYAAANEPKEFYPIVGADHNDTYFVGGRSYFAKVRDFALRIVPPRP